MIKGEEYDIELMKQMYNGIAEYVLRESKRIGQLLQYSYL